MGFVTDNAIDQISISHDRIKDRLDVCDTALQKNISVNKEVIKKLDKANEKTDRAIERLIREKKILEEACKNDHADFKDFLATHGKFMDRDEKVMESKMLIWTIACCIVSLVAMVFTMKGAPLFRGIHQPMISQPILSNIFPFIHSKIE